MHGVKVVAIPFDSKARTCLYKMSDYAQKMRPEQDPKKHFPKLSG